MIKIIMIGIENKNKMLDNIDIFPAIAITVDNP